MDFFTLFPILKRVAPEIGKQALETGVQIVKDVAGGQSIKDAAKTRVVEAIEKGINKFATDLNQTKSGKHRKHTRYTKIRRKK